MHRNMADINRKLLRRYELYGDCRFLTFSCYQRLPLFSNDAIKDRFIEAISRCREATAFKLLGYVIMPEHVHLLLVPSLPRHPVSGILSHLKARFSHEVLSRWRQLEAPILARVTDRRGVQHFWQAGGGYDRNIHSAGDLEETLNYIHLNPIRRGLVTSDVAWRWSSAAWYAGSEAPALSIDAIEL
jgi:putative transposase